MPERYWSGCWESNPVYTNPNRAYYRYTTPRYLTLESMYYKLFKPGNKSLGQDETPVVVVAGGYHTHWRFRLLVGHNDLPKTIAHGFG